ncbi:substrate-binding domain-containing protein [Streptomyces turgidiscabies]|uniref:Simple sugar transport system substrate-binding protein n=1 Tax=Streptomyces turgidiscabies TaxID=85558 RepID=A0ABU0RZQ6_9ACTN|nr:substrate-binding domain-containing protein [Streptomyces turgidiscabies]MDQ0937441.1 simple sugar transport system substrate-binding protein [Streptomyces turgidiscabies]
MNTPPASSGSARSARATAVAAGVAAVCLLAACSGSAGSDSAMGSAAVGTTRLKVALITHGAKGDDFWERVQKGARAAAAKDNIELTYASDPDAAAQADLVRDAVRDKADGIALTLAKPEAMKSAVSRAKAAGIPVVGLNSGIRAWRSTGLLEFFGQDESTAGRALGAKLDALKVRHTLCVIHEQGNIGLEARCAGVKKTFTGETDNLYVNGTDLDEVTAVITARLKQDPSIDEVVTLGAQFGLSAVKSVSQSGSRAKIATFDLNNDIMDAVKNGDVQFAVDQQPYLQGYLAVDSLWLYKSNGNFSGGGSAPVLTGPAFVTKQNVDDVARFAADGTR